VETVARGEIWWADLPDPVASAPGGTHPILVIQATSFNRSRISTILAAIITSNVRLGDVPGNVLVNPRESGLKRPSVVNVSQIITADRSFLRSRVGRLGPELMEKVDNGLKLIMSLA
jgi:mRNA interferase MazF